MPKIYKHLTRAVVMTMRADPCSIRSIAKRLCRSPSTIGRELMRSDGTEDCDASLACLNELWSPQQIACKLCILWPGNPERAVSCGLLTPCPRSPAIAIRFLLSAGIGA